MRLFELIGKHKRTPVDHSLPYDDHIEDVYMQELQKRGETGEFWRGPHEGRYIQLFLAGKKPAMIVDDWMMEPFDEYVKSGKLIQFPLKMPDHPELHYEIFVLVPPGQEFRAKKIQELYNLRPQMWDAGREALWHSKLGILLGYTNSDIRAFLKSLKLVESKDFIPFSTDPVTPNQMDMMKDPEYMAKKKGMIGEIEWMSPREYIDKCVAGFRSIGERGEVERGRDPKLIKQYAQDMKNGDKFPMLSLDYRGGFGQEGLHRAMAAEMIGVEKVPVFVTRESPEFAAKREREWEERMKEIKAKLEPDEFDKQRQSDVVDDILGAFNTET